MPTDALQSNIATGQVVNVPCVVTAITDTTQPTVMLQTVYKGFNAAVDVIGPLDAIQVIIAQ